MQLDKDTALARVHILVMFTIPNVCMRTVSATLLLLSISGSGSTFPTGGSSQHSAASNMNPAESGTELPVAKSASKRNSHDGHEPSRCGTGDPYHEELEHAYDLRRLKHHVARRGDFEGLHYHQPGCTCKNDCRTYGTSDYYCESNSGKDNPNDEVGCSVYQWAHIGEPGSSNRKTLIHCLNKAELEEHANKIVAAKKAKSRVEAWHTFGGSGGTVQTSHAELDACGSNFVSWRPPSPCLYPEITDAYMETADQQKKNNKDRIRRDAEALQRYESPASAPRRKDTKEDADISRDSQHRRMRADCKGTSLYNLPTSLKISGIFEGIGGFAEHEGVYTIAGCLAELPFYRHKVSGAHLAFSERYGWQIKKGSCNTPLDSTFRGCPMITNMKMFKRDALSSGTSTWIGVNGEYSATIEVCNGECSDDDEGDDAYSYNDGDGYTFSYSGYGYISGYTDYGYDGDDDASTGPLYIPRPGCTCIDDCDEYNECTARFVDPRFEAGCNIDEDEFWISKSTNTTWINCIPEKNEIEGCDRTGTASEELAVSGVCDYLHSMNTVFMPQRERTADGRMYFRSKNGYTLYYDSDCSGNGDAPRWIFSNGNPSTTATSDLDSDETCSYFARKLSNSMSPPSNTEEWRTYCGASKGWVDTPLTIRASCICEPGYSGDDCAQKASTTATVTTRTTTTAAGPPPPAPTVLRLRFNVLDTSGLSKTFCNEFTYRSIVWCECPDKDSCMGGECMGFTSGDKAFEAHEKSCTDCFCDFRVPPDYINHVADTINRDDLLGFGSTIQVEGSMNSVAPSAELWSEVLDESVTASKELRVKLYDLFSIAYGASTKVGSVDRISDCLEIIIVPTLSRTPTSRTLGIAMPRGDVSRFSESTDLEYLPITTYLSYHSFFDNKAHPAGGYSPGFVTIIHEIGHLVGLFHTFQDTNHLVGSGTCQSCAPREDNSEITGDMVADTPPVTTIGMSRDNNYPTTSGYRLRNPPDASGLEECTALFGQDGLCSTIDTTVHKINNWMSYGGSTCKDTFTPVQKARIQCFIDQDFRDFHLPTLPPAIVPFTFTTVVEHSGAKRAELMWVPPMSSFWCKDTRPGGCVQGYQIRRTKSACDSGILKFDEWHLVQSVGGDVQQFIDDAVDATDADGKAVFKFQVLAVDMSGNIGKPYAKIWNPFECPFVDETLTSTTGTTEVNAGASDLSAISGDNDPGLDESVNAQKRKNISSGATAAVIIIVLVVIGVAIFLVWRDREAEDAESDLPAVVAFTNPTFMNVRDDNGSQQGTATSKAEPQDVAGFSVSDIGRGVIVKGVGSGTIRFVGLNVFSGEPQIGVEYNKPKGTHSGIVQNVRYFECDASKGTLVKTSSVTFNDAANRRAATTSSVSAKTPTNQAEEETFSGFSDFPGNNFGTDDLPSLPANTNAGQLPDNYFNVSGADAFDDDAHDYQNTAMSQSTTPTVNTVEHTSMNDAATSGVSFGFDSFDNDGGIDL
eukprot:gene16239-21922_t